MCSSKFQGLFEFWSIKHELFQKEHFYLLMIYVTGYQI